MTLACPLHLDFISFFSVRPSASASLPIDHVASQPRALSLAPCLASCLASDGPPPPSAFSPPFSSVLTAASAASTTAGAFASAQHRPHVLAIEDQPVSPTRSFSSCMPLPPVVQVPLEKRPARLTVLSDPVTMGDDSSPSTTSTTADASDSSISHKTRLVFGGGDASDSQFPLPEHSPSHDHDLAIGSSDRARPHNLPAPLRISTAVSAPVLATPTVAHRGSLTGNASLSPSRVLAHKASHNSLRPVSRTPSLKSAVTHSLGSASSSSVVPSPLTTAMGDVTPLPSPLLSGDSPGPWRMLSINSESLSQIRARMASTGDVSILVTHNGELVESAAASAPKRKLYAAIHSAGSGPHAPSCQQQDLPQLAHKPKNRSVSEYTSEPVAGPKRPVSVSGSHIKFPDPDQEDSQIRREINYAESRGLTPTVTQPPTPPPSESSKDYGDGGKIKEHNYEYFDARDRRDQKMRRWRSIGFLDQGTFSRVLLATSRLVPDKDNGASNPAGPMTPVTECGPDRKKLVAVKVCEHGPRGGAYEERVEMSLKRELEILQAIHHPSLVNLKAWTIEPTRAILVLSYSPGGDLFELATAYRKVLTFSLLRRMFGELVGAVCYLHGQNIVHRDIKLESKCFPHAPRFCMLLSGLTKPRSDVLVNLSPAELADQAQEWERFPQSIITLTDLGLSRRIAEGEQLETRCGSDDYAAPELIMGQPYDGRAIDAWSLGVLLYALLEARLPFDPHPGMSDAHRMRSRTSHRIARVEWHWIEYAGEDGEHDGNLAKFEERGCVGAMTITEGLLKRARSRWSVDKVAEQSWVRDAIQVEHGLRFWDEEDGQEF